jgi:hypothetical protein
MKNCATAARIVAIAALFALPLLLLPDDAAAGDRRYGNTRPGRTSHPGSQNPPPTITQKQAKDMARAACKGLAYTNPTEAKECLARHR